VAATRARSDESGALAGRTKLQESVQ